MRTTIALDSDLDFLTGTITVGSENYTTFAICSGAEMVAQNIKTGLGLSQGDLWFNLAYGIDKQTLFYNPTLSDSELEPIRALAIKEFLQSFEDVSEVDGEASFTRTDRTLSIKVPCVILTCEASTQRIDIGDLNVC